MQASQIPVPHLTTALSGSLFHVEQLILTHVAKIETWFRKQWQLTPAPLMTSVDLRHAGYKIAPVDTNLFPAGFNNLNPDFFPLCVQALQSALFEQYPNCTRILIIPENHTRNKFYLESLATLQDIFIQAGYEVRIGSLDTSLHAPKTYESHFGKSVLFDPVVYSAGKLGVSKFEPCIVILNNDLSDGVPPVLQQITQPLLPSLDMGWSSRLKSLHFEKYQQVVSEFCELIEIDSWYVSPYCQAANHVDFMSQSGMVELSQQVDSMLERISKIYAKEKITDKPFVVVKADNGTYGMGVTMVHSGQELLSLNRKQRTKMAATKGGNKLTKVIIQEGVYSKETLADGAPAEPVVYMIGGYVVGGFYRVHKERGSSDNLNAPGMHFEPLAFAKVCNTPRCDLNANDSPNRFYAFGVIARLAALAAAREIASLKETI